MNLLVCSIGSEKAEVTLRLSLQVAQALGADTTLMGIVARQGSRAVKLREALERAQQELAGRGLAAGVRLEVGAAEEVVLNSLAETDYDLVVLGALANKRSRKSFLSSVAMTIVERAGSSVLLVKGDRTNLRRVVICASGAEYGHAAVRAGATLACGLGAEVTLLHVVDAMPGMYAGLELMEESLAEFLQAGSGPANELKRASRVVDRDCAVAEVKLRRGLVADEILREANAGDHDLIVMGSSRAAGGLVRLLLGDLTREVINRSERPVLVVRPATRPDPAA
jgi:nucleotide-binding universal stress UspA family protein